MKNVGLRRAYISLLLQQAQMEASIKGKKIETVDPLVICAKRMFPYLPDSMIFEYARTALRVIRNGRRSQAVVAGPQTTLLAHFVR